MVKFNTAIKWMRAGKKVKRPSWKEGSYLILGVDESILYKGITSAHIHLNQIEATDWEIYPEKPEELKTLKDSVIPVNKKASEINWNKKEKPKTLKDIVEGYSEIEFKTSSIAGFYEALKQEAIKDIKVLGKNRSSNEDFSKEELKGIDKYIKWKFNITEEDLK